jgi:hypothetical protein
MQNAKKIIKHIWTSSSLITTNYLPARLDSIVIIQVNLMFCVVVFLITPFVIPKPAAKL